MPDFDSDIGSQDKKSINDAFKLLSIYFQKKLCQMTLFPFVMNKTE